MITCKTRHADSMSMIGASLCSTHNSAALAALIQFSNSELKLCIRGIVAVASATAGFDRQLVAASPTISATEGGAPDKDGASRVCRRDNEARSDHEGETEAATETT